jgi:hypothetical protein
MLGENTDEVGKRVVKPEWIALAQALADAAGAVIRPLFRGSCRPSTKKLDPLS